MPDVSVIVPTHNRSAWLRLTLTSVLGQRGVDLEVLVVDDGSIDDTAGTVKALGDPRVRLLRHERPEGVSATRNHGAAEAHGEWLGFVDDDDLWAPEKLARQLEAAEGHGRAWAYTGSVNVDDDLRVLAAIRPFSPREVVHLVPHRNVIPGGGSNVIMRRDAFARVGPFDTHLKNTEDWEMWIRLASVSHPAWAPEPLLAYRLHSANASLDIEEIFAGVALIEQRHGTRVDRGVLNRWIAESCLRNGQRREALKHFAQAALRGQARNVTGDLFMVLQRRVHRLLGSTEPTQRDSDDDWIETAQAWVDKVAAQGGKA
jgi:glycosyltransferase involved in cell wall biosynthesis